MEPSGKDQGSRFRLWSLGVLAVGAVSACALATAIARYYFVEMPWLKTEICNRNMELAALKQAAAPVEKVCAEIRALSERVALLDELSSARMRYGRVLDRVCTAAAAQEGVWLRTLRIEPNAEPPLPHEAPGAKRYRLTIGGAIRGAEAPEREAKLAELLKLLRKECETWQGYSRKLRAAFEHPVVLERKSSGTALEFTLRLDFATDPRPAVPDDAQPFIFREDGRRDPFAPK